MSPKFTPKTKHIAIKYHHFRKHAADKTMSISPIDTKDQLADIFTKPLDRVIFRKLLLILMGWYVLFTALLLRDCEDTGILTLTWK